MREDVASKIITERLGAGFRRQVVVPFHILEDSIFPNDPTPRPPARRSGLPFLLKVVLVEAGCFGIVEIATARWRTGAGARDELRMGGLSATVCLGREKKRVKIRKTEDDLHVQETQASLTLLADW